MTTSWAPPATTLIAAPWPAPDPATRVVDIRAACPWPAPRPTDHALQWDDGAPTRDVMAPSRRRYPLAIALGTAMVAIAAFGALFLAI
ncbi:MAG: hypothetical protein AAGF73_10505 [Actinomycetota bacterium]